MKKIIFLLTIFSIGISLLPIDAHAITTGIDQRCFEKKKCVQTRRNANIDFGNQKPEDGFIQNQETTAACGQYSQGATGEPMGFCLPVGQTETMVSFGGRRKFSDIGDFIRYMYKYAIMVAGLLSTLMIIVAGFQWAVSGGNSSTIQSAQKKIGGSIIGLMIAVLSYTILNWVNPNLVNFRLPQIWLINTIQLQNSPYCSDLPDGTKLAFFRQQDDKSITGEKAKEKAKGPYKLDKLEGDCGSYYFVENGGGQYCHGTSGSGSSNNISCSGENEICGSSNDKAGQTGLTGTDRCYKGDILVQVYQKPNGLFGNKDWEGFPWLSSGNMYGLCASGKQFDVSTSNNLTAPNETDHLLKLSFSVASGPKSLYELAKSECGDADPYNPQNFKGFFISVGMDKNWNPFNQTHYIGQDGKGNGIDLGDDTAMEKIRPQLRSEFLFPLEAFVIQKNQQVGGKIRIRLNVNDVAVIQEEKDRELIYNQLGIQ